VEIFPGNPWRSVLRSLEDLSSGAKEICLKSLVLRSLGDLSSGISLGSVLESLGYHQEQRRSVLSASECFLQSL
jgi:type II secretory pathway component PulF